MATAEAVVIKSTEFGKSIAVLYLSFPISICFALFVSFGMKKKHTHNKQTNKFANEIVNKWRFEQTG